MSQNPYWQPRRPAAETEPNLSVRRVENPPMPIHEDRSPSVAMEHQATILRNQLNRAESLIRFLFGGLTWLIAVRMLLMLITANPENTITRLTFALTGSFMAPFEGIAPRPQFGPFEVDMAGFVAITFYAMLTWFIIKVMWLILYNPNAPIRPTSPRRDKTSEFRIR